MATMACYAAEVDVTSPYAILAQRNSVLYAGLTQADNDFPNDATPSKSLSLRRPSALLARRNSSAEPIRLETRRQSTCGSRNSSAKSLSSTVTPGPGQDLEEMKAPVEEIAATPWVSVPMSEATTAASGRPERHCSFAGEAAAVLPGPRSPPAEEQLSDDDKVCQSKTSCPAKLGQDTGSSSRLSHWVRQRGPPGSSGRVTDGSFTARAYSVISRSNSDQPRTASRPAGQRGRESRRHSDAPASTWLGQGSALLDLPEGSPLLGGLEYATGAAAKEQERAPVDPATCSLFGPYDPVVEALERGHVPSLEALTRAAVEVPGRLEDAMALEDAVGNIMTNRAGHAANRAARCRPPPRNTDLLAPGTYIELKDPSPGSSPKSGKVISVDYWEGVYKVKTLEGEVQTVPTHRARCLTTVAPAPAEGELAELPLGEAGPDQQAQ